MKSRFLVFVSRLLAFLATSAFKVKQPIVSSLIAMLVITPKGVSRVHYSILPNFDKSAFPDGADVLRLSIQFHLIDMSMMTMQITVLKEDYLGFVKDLGHLFSGTVIEDATGASWGFMDYWTEGAEGLEGDIVDPFKNKHFHEAGVDGMGTTTTFKTPMIEEDVSTWPVSLSALIKSPIEQELEAAQEEQGDALEVNPLLEILENNPFALFYDEGTEERLPYMHSIGMCRHGCPEVALVGLQQEGAMPMIADICAVLLSNKVTEIPEDGIVFASEEDAPRRCILKPWLADRIAPADAAARADWYATRENLPWSLGQVFWSDENGKFEWEEGFNAELVGKQVLEI